MNFDIIKIKFHEFKKINGEKSFSKMDIFFEEMNLPIRAEPWGIKMSTTHHLIYSPLHQFSPNRGRASGY